MSKFLKIITYILAGFLLIQLIPIDRTQHVIDKKLQFENVENTPPKIASLMRNACYDCHSFESKYPDYAYIAPISWAVSRHVKEGRRIANFSTWANYNPDLQRSILKFSIQSLKDGSMPDKSYIVYHPEANISPEERTLLQNYFKKVLDSGTHTLK